MALPKLRFQWQAGSGRPGGLQMSGVQVLSGGASGSHCLIPCVLCGIALCGKSAMKPAGSLILTGCFNPVYHFPKRKMSSLCITIAAFLNPSPPNFLSLKGYSLSPRKEETVFSKKHHWTSWEVLSKLYQSGCLINLRQRLGKTPLTSNSIFVLLIR